MLKINWYIEEYPRYNATGGTEVRITSTLFHSEKEAITGVKDILAFYEPNSTILVENRGVYVLDLTDIKMYHSSKSLKPLWRIGDGFSKTLIAEIVEAENTPLTRFYEDFRKQGGVFR